MIKGFEELQRFNQQSMDAAMRSLGGWSKSWQNITVEMSDYAKRSLENGASTFEKLVSSRSLEQAVQIQSDFATRAYDDYVAQLTKISNIYAQIAREAYQPAEQDRRGAETEH